MFWMVVLVQFDFVPFTFSLMHQIFSNMNWDMADSTKFVATPTPLLDSMWDPRVLELAYIMMGRLLCGFGPNDDHWELGLVALGDAKAHEAFLFVLQHMLQVRNPEAPAASLIAFDDKPWFMARAVQSGASLLALRTKVFSLEWVSKVTRESIVCRDEQRQDLVVPKWNIPVVSLVPLWFSLEGAKSSIKLRVVPFHITCPVHQYLHPSEPSEKLQTPEVVALVNEIAPFCAKVEAAYIAALAALSASKHSDAYDPRILRKIRNDAQGVL